MTTYQLEFSQPADQREGTHLVLLLHGYGSHEQDLLGLVPHLPQEGITYASLRAPQPVGYQLPPQAESALVPGLAPGYQWWPLDARVEAPGFYAVQLAVDYLLDWLQPQAQTYRSLNLLGFSQGMALATSVARRRPDLIKTVMGLSGYAVAGGEGYFRDAHLRQQPLPLFWGRDATDPVISPQKITETQAWVQDHTRAHAQLYPGIGHGISALEISHLADFIRAEILN